MRAVRAARITPTMVATAARLACRATHYPAGRSERMDVQIGFGRQLLKLVVPRLNPTQASGRPCPLT